MGDEMEGVSTLQMVKTVFTIKTKAEDPTWKAAGLQKDGAQFPIHIDAVYKLQEKFVLVCNLWNKQWKTLSW